MPRITAGVPLIVTLEGLKEQTQRPADTETRLYFEMQLDRGEAVLTPLDEVEGHWWNDGVAPDQQFTHRLTSETGGTFHVRVEEGPTEWPVVSAPPAFLPLVEMVQALERMNRQIVTLLAANALLEKRVKELEGEL
jgi:hypothetical protein